MSSYSKKMIFNGGGSGDFVDCGSNSNIDNLFDNGATWSAWISGVSDGGSSTGTILSKSQVRLRTIEDGGDDLTLQFIYTAVGDNGAWHAPSTALLKNKLNHVAVTMQSSSGDPMTYDPIIYINGVSQTVTESTAPGGARDTDAGSSFVIGNVDTSNGHQFHGFIDEVSIFRKALTQSEVQEIYNSGTALDVRDHSCYLSNELVVNSDFSGGVQGNGLPNGWEHHADNTSTAEVGTFKGKENVVKIVTQGDDLSQSKLAQNFTFRNNTIYQLEAEVFIESGRFKFDTEDSNFSSHQDILTDDNDSERGYWRTIKKTITTKSTAEGTGDHLFLRSPEDVASVIYINKVSVKSYDLGGYWRNNGYETWFDLSPYGNNGTVNGTYPELVTNGDFSSALDSNDWAGVSDGVPTINGSNQLVVTITNDDYGSAVQEITGLEVGAEYDLTGTIISTTLEALLAVQTSETTGVVQSFGALPTSSHLGTPVSRRIIAPQETLYIAAITKKTGSHSGNSVFDNISFNKTKPIQKFLQEVPFFNKDSLGLPMNRVRQQGLNFDGNAYAEAKDDDSLGTIAGGFSCAYWYRHVEDVAAAANVDYPYFWTVTKGSGLGTSVDNAFASSVYNNKIYSDLNTSAGRFSLNYDISPGSTNSPIWYYVTATYTPGEKFRQYINGVETNVSSTITGTFSATAESHPLRVGTRGNNLDSFARSVIDEVKWYNKPLSASEVKRNYNASKGRHKSTSNWSDDFSNDFI